MAARRTGKGAMTLGAFAVATAALALVIWIKLRVVSSVPRSAYAEPEKGRASEAR